MLDKLKRRFLLISELRKAEGTIAVIRRVARKILPELPEPKVTMPVAVPPEQQPLKVPQRPVIECCLDFPLDNSIIDSNLEISGWAFSRAAEIERIEVFLDGQLLGEAEYGAERFDVADAFSDPEISRCGFVGFFIIEPKPNDATYEVLIRLRDKAGNSTVAMRGVKSRANSSTRIAVPALDFSARQSQKLQALSQSAVSVVIPVLNAGDELAVLLSALKAQEGIKQLELIVIDSGSRDHTVATAHDYGAKVIEIAPKDFSHSKTRNLGAESASGDFLVFMTQDALPGSNTWLYEMVDAAQKYDAVAVTCAESPRADVDLFYRVNSWSHHRFMGIAKNDLVATRSPSEDYESIRKHCQLNNVACLVERAVFMKYQFQHDYAEDLDLGMRLSADGHKLAMLASTKVIHSHNRTAYYHLRRSYVDTRHLAQLFSDFPLQPFLTLEELSKEILSSYTHLVFLVDDLCEQIELPCRTIDIFTAIRKAWESHRTITITGSDFFAKQQDLDERYRNFLERFANDHLPTGFLKPGSFIPPNGPVTIAVRHTIWRTMHYLQTAHEKIDKQLFAEFKQSVFKAHAQATGVILASHFLKAGEQNIEINQEADRRLEQELRQGV